MFIRKQFCPKNHDTFITGRYSKGNCKACLITGKSRGPHSEATKIKMSLKATGRKHTEATKLKMSGPRDQFCKYGHDTFRVGRNKSGGCRSCERDRSYADHGVLNEKGEPFTAADYDRYFENQDGRCKIRTCNKHQSELKERLNVDHNHTTGTARALLCKPCNIRIGAKENQKFIEADGEYLRGY